MDKNRRLDEFVSELNTLCEKHGMALDNDLGSIVVVPLVGGLAAYARSEHTRNVLSFTGVIDWRSDV